MADSKKQADAIQREDPEVDESRKALVTDWVKRVKEAKKHWEPRFNKMRRHQKFVRGHQWPGQAENDDRYRANITRQAMSRRVASVYARNPTFVFERRKKLDFVMWDGKPESLIAAGEGAAMGDADSLAILAEVDAALKKRQMVVRMGKTLQLVFAYQLEEGKPRFKLQAKQAVRRAKTNGVAFCKVGYQRTMDYDHDGIRDATEKIKNLEMLSADMADGKIDTPSKELELLRLQLRELAASKDQLLYEGLVFDWPLSTQIIVDPGCTQLKGFVGAEWIAHELIYSRDKIKKRFGCDLGDSYSKYDSSGKRGGASATKRPMACVWEIWDLVSGIKYFVCDGYSDFLREPAESDIYYEQGHPFGVLTFNDLEDEDDIYPESDVEAVEHTQREHNRSRQAQREHRKAATPAYVSANGVFEKEDKAKLSNHLPMELIELDGLKANDQMKIGDKLQMKPTPPYDPAIYDTAHLFQDMLHVLGDQEANLGGTSGDTATETSIAESSRMSGVSSDADELDEFFTDIAFMASDILLLEMAPETAKAIAGDGAVWPEIDRKAAMQDLWLIAKAGSSGRPNRANKIAMKERLMPSLLQMPNISPMWLAKSLVADMDDEIDLEEAIAEGSPSVIAMNQAMQPSTGNPATDPNQQGGEGSGNAPAQPEQEQGSQPAYPVDNNDATS